MSGKEKTTGEELEDFLSFVMSYTPPNTKKKMYKPSEIRDIYRQNNMTDEMLYKRLLGLGVVPEEAQKVTQQILHPTEEELEREKTIKKKDLH